MLKMISIIIPAYNEEEGIKDTLVELVESMSALEYAYEIIVVDDGSIDATYSIVKELEQEYQNILRVEQHVRNKGYGSSIKTAIQIAEGDYIAWYDADGQHRPEDLIVLINKIIDMKWDYCIGIRGEESYVDPNRKLGKFLLKKIVDFCAKEKTEDFNSGMRIFKKNVLKQCVSLLPRRFGASTVTTLLMQELEFTGGGVYIQVRKRVGKSSVKQIRDGIRTIGLVFQIILLFRPMQVFSGIGVLTSVLGIAYSIIKVMIVQQGFPTLGAIVILFGVQFFVLGIISSQISQLRLEIINFGAKNSAEK